MAFGDIAPIQPPNVSHGTKMVEVVVGKDRKAFKIHSALLVSSSPIFRQCISELVGHESNDTKVEIDCGWDGCHTTTLHSEHPSVFKVFYDWLYSGRIPGNFTVHKVAGDDRYIDTVWLDTLKMGNRLEITSIADIASGKIHELFSTETPLIPSKQFIEILFSSWDSNMADLQQQIAGHVVYCLTKSVDRSDFTDLFGIQRHSFLYELGNALLDQVSTGDLRFGSHGDRVYKVECPHCQPFGHRGEDTAPKASHRPRAPFGLRYVVSDEPSNCWQRNVDAGSDAVVQGDQNEVHDVTQVNVTDSELNLQERTACADLGLPSDFLGPSQGFSWANASRAPRRVGFPPPYSGVSNMPGPGKMASPEDHNHSTSFTSSGPGAPTPATDWTSLERQTGGGLDTDQPLNCHWYNQSSNQATYPHQTANLRGRFEGLILDQGTDPVPAHNAQHFQLLGQVRRHVSMQAPFASAVPATGQSSSFAAPIGPPQTAVQNPGPTPAFIDRQHTSAATTAPTWYNGRQTVKTPGPPMTFSANYYQDNWSNNLSSMDAAVAAERADKKRVNTWTTTALDHTQFGRDIKKEASKKEDDGWDASAGEKKDHLHTCTQHVCGLDVGGDECGCEDNPVKLTTDASGWNCTAANNNDGWGGHYAKANQGWGASAEEKGDNICSCSGWGIGDGCWDWHYKDPATVKSTASGLGRPVGNNDHSWANQGWGSSGINDNSDNWCADGCCTTVGGWDTSTPTGERWG
ncbi:hypothetical protein LTS15_009296 [Exophiala xenobiotica]|nr:hypothetical protein LTS15_009296 [Exophiala xenobiotica]